MKSIKGGKHPGDKKNDKKEQGSFFNMMEKGLLPSTQKKTIVQNTSGIKYSQLLLELVEPHFSSQDPDLDEMEYMLDMGVAAWNLAVYKKEAHEFYKIAFENLFRKSGMPAESYNLIKLMIAEKEKNFTTHKILLIDYEIKFDNGDKPLINVISKQFDGLVGPLFPESMQERMKEEEMDWGYDDDDDDDDALLLDRAAVTIKPKQPFFDWLKTTYPPESDDDPQKLDENNVYLIPDNGNDDAPKKWLKKNFDKIFIHELNDWHTDENDWPQKRTWKIFQQWFDIELNTMVFDLG